MLVEKEVMFSMIYLKLRIKYKMAFKRYELKLENRMDEVSCLSDEKKLFDKQIRDSYSNCQVKLYPSTYDINGNTIIMRGEEISDGYGYIDGRLRLTALIIGKSKEILNVKSRLEKKTSFKLKELEYDHRMNNPEATIKPL